MKTPENLLPIYVMERGFARTSKVLPHRIYSAKDDLIMLADVYQDNLIAHESSEYNSLEFANYLCEAANKFPKAIDLLKLCARELHQFYNTDESQALSETEAFLKDTSIVNIEYKTKEELEIKLDQANKLLKRAVNFMNLVPNKKYDNHYPLCSEIDNFLK